MKQKPHFITLAFIIILLTLTCFFPVKAQGIIIGDTIPEGQTVLSNAILIGDTITIDGNIDGDVLAIGRRIILNGQIEGSGIILSQSSDIRGQVNGSLYSGGQNTILSDYSSLVNDLYFVGLQLTTQPESQVGRDILAITVGASLQGEVGRDIRGLIGPIPIVQAILDLFGKSLPYLESGNLTGMKQDPYLLPIVKVSETVKGPMSIDWKTAGTALLGLPNYFNQKSQEATEAIDTAQVVDWLLAQLRNLINVFIYSVIAMLLFPKFLEQTSEKLWQKPAQSTGVGLLAVIFIFTATLLIAILLVPLILFFSKLTLISFSVFTFLIGYTTLTLAGAFIYLFSVFVTKGLAGKVFVQKIFGRFAPKVAKYRFLMLFLGSLVYVLLRSIPFLGILIGFWISLLGLGAVWLVWNENKKIKKQPQLIVEENNSEEILQDSIEEP
jgi:hypothetical protein